MAVPGVRNRPLDRPEAGGLNSVRRAEMPDFTGEFTT